MSRPHAEVQTKEKSSDRPSFTAQNPIMVITGDELHAEQATCHRALQEDPPVDFMFAQGDLGCGYMER